MTGQSPSERIREVLYGEVATCAGHTNHGSSCNCGRTVACVMQRLRTDLRPSVEAWLREEANQ